MSFAKIKGGKFVSENTATFDLAIKQPKYLTNYSWDVEDARLSKNRKLLACTLNENGMSTLHAMQLDVADRLALIST